MSPSMYVKYLIGDFEKPLHKTLASRPYSFLHTFSDAVKMIDDISKKLRCCELYFTYKEKYILYKQCAQLRPSYGRVVY